MSKPGRKRRKGKQARPNPQTTAAPSEVAVPPPQVLNPQPLNKGNREQRLMVQKTVTAYQGPIPPPAFLTEYSGAISNGGERVFALIEAEAQHVQAQERAILKAQVQLLKRGQWFAFLVALIAMGGAAYTAQFSVGLATAMVTVGVGTLAVAFLSMLKKGTDEKGKK